jgi:hypothetical protein
MKVNKTVGRAATFAVDTENVDGEKRRHFLRLHWYGGVTVLLPGKVMRK